MAKHHYRRNSTHHQALVILGRGDTTGEVIRRQITQMCGITQIEQLLKGMMENGHIMSIGKGGWSLTQEGLDVSLALGDLEDKVNFVAPKAADNLFNRPVYNAAELRDACVRPGAYDFRQYPSRMGDSRVWYGLGLRQVTPQSPVHR